MSVAARDRRVERSIDALYEPKASLASAPASGARTDESMTTDVWMPNKLPTASLPKSLGTAIVWTSGSPANTANLKRSAATTTASVL